MRDDAAPGPLTHGSAARAGGGHGLSPGGTGSVLTSAETTLRR